MFSISSLVKYSILSMLFVQHFKYILYLVEGKSYSDTDLSYEPRPSYRRLAAAAYDSSSGNSEYHRHGNGLTGSQRLRQPNTGDTAQRRTMYGQQRNMATGNQWREGNDNDPGPQNAECDIDGDHVQLIYVPTEAVEKYSWVTKMSEDKTQRVTPIKICCPGYGLMRWQGKRRCVPVCDNCRNGRCVAPNVCECYDEYVRNDNGDCVFTCPLGCLNGRCYLDGSCECDPGYKLDETRQFCRPICSKGCGTDLLHNCTAPEICGCIKGFTLMDGGCKPVCEPECGVGGECESTGASSLSRACVCRTGYRLKDGVCQSDCYQSCNDGICYSRNRCICNPGFVYHERTRNCIPQ